MRRRTSLIILAVVIPAGLGTKLYRGPLDEWVVRYGGDIAVPVFLFFLAMLVRPGLPPRACGLAVFFFCAAVELTQLSSTPLLETIRGSVPGRTVLGSDFDPRDFVCYAIGVAVSVALYRLFSARREPGRRTCDRSATARRGKRQGCLHSIRARQINASRDRERSVHLMGASTEEKRR